MVRAGPPAAKRDQLLTPATSHIAICLSTNAEQGLRLWRSRVALWNDLGLALMRKTSEDVPNQDASASTYGAGLSDQVVAFIESGVSIVMGVAWPRGQARTGRALAARVMKDGTIRLVYAEPGNAAITASAAGGGPIAVTFSAPLSNRTVQIKGFFSRTEELQQEDRDCVRQQTDAFAQILAAVGEPPRFVQAFCDYRTSPLSVLSFPAQEAFEQTPGPGAGRAL